MRCPDCNKFVGQEPGEVEVNTLEIDESGHITCEARLPINCADCGSELKEGNFQMEEDLPQEIADEHFGNDHELSIEEDGSDIIDEYKTTDRHGKPIKNSRYQAHIYGVSINFTVSCSCQEEGASSLHCGTLEDKMNASSFDELV